MNNFFSTVQQFILLLLSILLFNGCKDPFNRFDTKFSGHVSGDAPGAVIYIDNIVVGDWNHYKWKGSDGFSHNGKTIDSINVSRPGDYTLTLNVKSGLKRDSYSKTFTVYGYGGIKYFYDVVFRKSILQTDIPRCFSTSTGNYVLDEDVNENGATIDLVYNCTTGEFVSPDIGLPDLIIPDSTVTEFSITNFYISVLNFDYMINDKLLFEEGFFVNQERGKCSSAGDILIFMNSQKYIGAIHCKSVDNEKMLTDIAISKRAYQ